MYSLEYIKQKFDRIKENKFLNAQSKGDRLKSNPIKFVYIFLWQKMQSLLVYDLHIKKPLVSIKTFWGEKITMVLPRPSFLYFFGFLGKSELYLTDYLINNLKTGDVFIDGGANIGFYSLLASNLVGDSGSVHSFEPGKTTFSILRENVKSKNNIICNEKALWLKTESVSFVNNDLKDNLYGTIKKIGHNHISFDKSLEVNAVSLDDYCVANRVIPSIIKLDTEGTELDILKGSINVIINNHPIIVVEILKESIQHGLYKKFSSFLSPHSYKCYQLVGDYSEKEILERNDINTKFYNFVFK